MSRSLAALISCLLALLPVPGRAQAPEQPQPPRILLATPTVRPQQRALLHPLLPEPLDLEPGNAALLWIRAGVAAQQGRPRLAEEQYRWLSPEETPLERLPRADARALLGGYANALRLADSAARRQECDWGLPPVTLQNLQSYLPLDEVQHCREIARLLQLRYRLALADRDFGAALQTLQTTLALARHIGQGPLLIQSLVGVAIATIGMGMIEEMVQVPGSPSLYWPLTMLPDHLVDTRPAVAHELDTIYRSFPVLLRLERSLDEPVPSEEIEDAFGQVIEALQGIEGLQGGSEKKVSRWQLRLMLATLAVKFYPEARAKLLARGFAAAKVEAMPVLQVLALHYLGEYGYWRDELLKWQNVPAWQRRPRVEQLEKGLREAMRSPGNPFLLILPAVVKTQDASLRLQRHQAYLRCAEAVRLYAAGHEGRPPERLEDVTAVPLPVDPVTGKGFESFYQKKDGQGILDLPPLLPNLPPQYGRRYVLTPPR